MSEKCKKEARFVYPWSGKIMEACKDHAIAMCAIAKAIGYEMEIKSLSKNNQTCMHMDDLTK